MAKTKTQFVCSNCGYVSQRYMGRCANCGAWGTFVEEVVQPEKADRKSRVNLAGQIARVERLGESASKKRHVLIHQLMNSTVSWVVVSYLVQWC